MPSPPSPLDGPCTGTSFASPHVTGAYAVFVDWFRSHIADDGEELTPIPNDQQGWAAATWAA